ncbi:NUDIX domain-containing protein [Lacicoccus alkaliphilus]|uniref:ADP-ribose pyrophosphatase n=1 Tax=Lacicoccus alkaliphilus DSM 16010 TaxID=1123231 RepID=A0A1M7BE10_9BACL|nr:NUDIX hydrolase [Salinicoccus alkaliphilus]SHL53154.1 ADP-ribose pyrophosphatase [Salinicoccus alkaliphilus DSM 16010]
MKEEVIETEEIFNGRVIKVTHDKIRLPDGGTSCREIVHHKGAVALIAIHADHLYFVRQFRVPTGEVLLEIPAGKVETGEAPIETAKKELKEEIGAVAANINKLYEFYTAPGFASELIHLYIAEDLEFEEQALEKDEFLDIEKIPTDSLQDALDTGKFRDAKTIIAVQYVLSYL